MKVETKYISPQMAEEMLASTARNRPVSLARVMTLANLMRTSQWQMNGETVIVSKSGKLLDGQHRMYAIIEYGAPVQMLIASGAEESAFETIDTGRARSAADIAGIEGFSHPRLSAAAAAMIWRLFYKTSIGEPCPAQTTMRVIELFPAIQKWAPFVANLGQGSVVPGGTFLPALVYMEDIAQKPRLTEEFFNGVVKGADLHEGSPVLALRNRLMTMRNERRIMNATTCWAPVIRTVNAMEASEKMNSIRIEKSSGPVRRPALWDLHMENLPQELRIDEAWRLGRRDNYSGNVPGSDFHEKVKEIRSRAPDAAKTA